MSKRVRFQMHGWDNDKKITGVMADPSLNYFTCTLGQAAQWNREHPHPFGTINDLIDEQAKDLRQRPAVNFPGGCHGEEGREMKSGGSQHAHLWLSIRSSGCRCADLVSVSQTLHIENCGITR